MGVEVLRAGCVHRIFTRFSPTAYLVCDHCVLYFAQPVGNRTSANTECTGEMEVEMPKAYRPDYEAVISVDDLREGATVTCRECDT